MVIIYNTFFLFHLGLYDRAITTYTTLLAKDPNSASLLNSLAVVYQKAGQPKMTVQLYERFYYTHTFFYAMDSL